MSGLRSLAAAALVITLAAAGIAVFAFARLGESSEAPQNEFQADPTQGSSEESPKLERIVTYQPGFPAFDSFQDIRTLVDDSANIVIATLQDRRLAVTPQPYDVPVVCGTPRPYHAGKECSGSVTGTAGLYMSEYVFSIEEVLKSDGYKGSSITLVEPGGIVNGQEFVYGDRPFFEPGKSYLLFLLWWKSKPNTAGTNDGLWGAYEIRGGSIAHFDYAPSITTGAPAALIGLSEDDARALIAQTLAALSAP